MITIDPLDANELRQVLKVMKQIEPDSQKKLAAKLKSDLKPFATQIAEALPREAPLSRLYGPRWGWLPGKGTVGFTPGKSRQNATNLVAIRIKYGDSAGYPFGVWLGEFARTYNSNRGRALIQNLNDVKPMKGRGGRFSYAKFRMLRPDIVRVAKEILDDFMREVERKLS